MSNKLLKELRRQTQPHILEVVDLVWKQKERFICWPDKSILFMPGVVRTKTHIYTKEQMNQLKAKCIKPDARSNGPAIGAYLLAGGERLYRHGERRGWSIHHIYDGKFPALGSEATIHAVKNGNYFTESSGLVAIHPIADALADEVPYFAWLLRHTAFEKFNFDPDNAFLNIGG
jgi:hypothetical protein